jgi:hypothetical protein
MKMKSVLSFLVDDNSFIMPEQYKDFLVGDRNLLLIKFYSSSVILKA